MTTITLAGAGSSAGSITYLGGGPGTATYTLRVNDTVDRGVIGVGRLSNIEALTITVSAVPEPQANVLALAGTGFLALTAGAKRRRDQSAKT